MRSTVRPTCLAIRLFCLYIATSWIPRVPGISTPLHARAHRLQKQNRRPWPAFAGRTVYGGLFSQKPRVVRPTIIRKTQSMPGSCECSLIQQHLVPIMPFDTIGRRGGASRTARTTRDSGEEMVDRVVATGGRMRRRSAPTRPLLRILRRLTNLLRRERQSPGYALLTLKGSAPRDGAAAQRQDRYSASRREVWRRPLRMVPQYRFPWGTAAE